MPLVRALIPYGTTRSGWPSSITETSRIIQIDGSDTSKIQQIGTGRTEDEVMWKFARVRKEGGSGQGKALRLGEFQWQRTFRASLRSLEELYWRRIRRDNFHNREFAPYLFNRTITPHSHI